MKVFHFSSVVSKGTWVPPGYTLGRWGQWSSSDYQLNRAWGNCWLSRNEVVMATLTLGSPILTHGNPAVPGRKPTENERLPELRVQRRDACRTHPGRFVTSVLPNVTT